ncbi:hypothetical protein B0H19DRAFT_1069318 [Mycena capillaripes]|nr:hypothetical protein B0H19DRAFT_1069318 [Mycena capillaripes]
MSHAEIGQIAVLHRMGRVQVQFMRYISRFRVEIFYLFIRLRFSVCLKPFKLRLSPLLPYPMATWSPGSRVLPPAGTWPSNPSALTAFDVTFPTNFALAPELTDGSHHPETKGAAANTTLQTEREWEAAKRPTSPLYGWGRPVEGLEAARHRRGKRQPPPLHVQPMELFSYGEFNFWILMDSNSTWNSM